MTITNKAFLRIRNDKKNFETYLKFLKNNIQQEQNIKEFYVFAKAISFLMNFKKVKICYHFIIRASFPSIILDQM